MLDQIKLQWAGLGYISMLQLFCLYCLVLFVGDFFLYRKSTSTYLFSIQRDTVW